MTKYRQHILAGVFGLLVVYFGGDWLWTKAVQGPLEERRGETKRLEKEIKDREKGLAQARKAAKQLAVWEKESLCADPELARSLYQAWLLGLVKHVGLENPVVEVGEPAGRKGSYKALGGSIRGLCTLNQVTRFLYEFYQAGHLHQVRSVSLTPVGQQGRVDVSLAIEALVLPGADRQDRLSTQLSDRLAGRRLEDYRLIAQRNLFGTGTAADPVDYTMLTSVIYVDGVPEAWFSVRSSAKIVKIAPDDAGASSSAAKAPPEPGDVVKLHPGESFRVGDFTGKLVRVEDGDVILDADGQRWLLSIGETLAQAAAVPPGL